MPLLSAAHLLDCDSEKLADALLANAKQLVFAGRFEDARRLLEVFAMPQAAGLCAQDAVVRQLQRVFPLVSYLCDAACPGVGDMPQRSAQQMHQWGRDESERCLGLLSLPSGRLALGPAGQGWTRDHLASLSELADPVERCAAFFQFCVDAEFVLKERLVPNPAQPGAGERIVDALLAQFETGLEPELDDADLWALLRQPAPPIEIAQAARAIGTATIGATTAQYLRRHAGSDNAMTAFIFQAVAVLCLREGLRGAALDAINCLATSHSGADYLMDMVVLEPVRGVLASGECAAAVGMDGPAVAAYVDALHRRVRTL